MLKADIDIEDQRYWYNQVSPSCHCSFVEHPRSEISTDPRCYSGDSGTTLGCPASASILPLSRRKVTSISGQVLLWGRYHIIPTYVFLNKTTSTSTTMMFSEMVTVR